MLLLCLSMEMCNCSVTGLFITVPGQTVVLLHCDRTMLLLCLFSETCYYSVTELCCCSVCLQNNIIAVSVYIIVLLQCLSIKLLLWCLSTEYAVSVFSFFLVAECVWKKSSLVCRITQSALYRFWWTAANPQTGQLMVIISRDGSRLSKPAVWSACGL